jgi:drug/metabolite transporter (DMT)-like permease
VVAVLTALYPAGTVILARYVLGERMSTVQQAGLAFAGVAAVLIAA